MQGNHIELLDPRADTHVQVDASSHDLSAVLLQNGRPIAFASNSHDSFEESGCCPLPHRLQMMLIRIQPYDSVIRYISHVQFSIQKLDELPRETKNDNKLQSLLKVIADGWPDRQRDLHPQLRAFLPARDELVANDDIVLKGNEIVMPTSLHAETLAKLHESH